MTSAQTAVQICGKGEKMPNYHVGCGWSGIFAGTLNQKGDMWRNKSDVTSEALCAAAHYLLFDEKEFRFQHKDKWYTMRVEEMEGGEE